MDYAAHDSSTGQETNSMRTVKFDRAKFRMNESGAWLMLRIPIPYRQPARAFVMEMKQDKAYVAEIRQHREKRSLDANAYFWVLCGRLAAVTGIPKEDIYRDYVRQIGDNFEVIPVRNDAVKRWKTNWESRGEGWPCESLGGSKLPGYTNMVCYYGSCGASSKMKLVRQAKRNCEKKRNLEKH